MKVDWSGSGDPDYPENHPAEAITKHPISLVILSGITPVTLTILMSDEMGCRRHLGD